MRRIACTHLTRRGHPCRNPATPGSDPPACARHGRMTNDELRMTNEARHAPRQLALPWGDGEKGGKGEGEKGSVGLRPVAPPLTTDPLTTAPLTTAPLKTDPLNTAPLTTAPLNTDPLTTDPLTTDPLTTPHFYFPHPTAADRSVLEAGADADLRPELELSRVVLRRLMALLDTSGDDLPPDELRRISALAFTGARTVALLAGKHATRLPEVDDWLAAALSEMGEKTGWAL